uniref:Uncharacterized protein n=1 Tax=Nelumbo nucifera TaxID=4432 RepID=A0A822YYG4_NELNU|nr:TPA_asm: hypothetical protein HUJ06_008181 [Nelumbo nucifera]
MNGFAQQAESAVLTRLEDRRTPFSSRTRAFHGPWLLSALSCNKRKTQSLSLNLVSLIHGRIRHFHCHRDTQRRKSSLAGLFHFKTGAEEEGIAAQAAEQAKQEALKDDHDAFTVVIAVQAGELSCMRGNSLLSSALLPEAVSSAAARRECREGVVSVDVCKQSRSSDGSRRDAHLPTTELEEIGDDFSEFLADDICQSTLAKQSPSNSITVSSILLPKTTNGVTLPMRLCRKARRDSTSPRHGEVFACIHP